ncbi:demethoxyubiquinone hydroxylase family protein [Paucibacter sp. DJ2R-2]|uniref:demethoxyubiquinone hydroxylase family protein n=1 Tax=Paucibacter sp. DJ2R-2 TaxID=2893558 RepID=UPI0021E40BB6|nr:demethoxyubiquinone hydroxylase family protein [Paucibacter sp. DJ2R-2]MCV2422311.1 demethoxyubiquinone hydroxylase family protein [Paucibacter sp. DJ4R-1]MCV2440537.1 demethoxyubiquinone hydroxylase family protein [Paucibacter sp. DJ2R-2]
MPEDSELGSRILKVNHAGEHGAICIYTGQIIAARLTARDMVMELEEFKSHEKRHRYVFWSELQRRGRRRCRSYWLCALGGFVLGLATGLLGRKAIASTTVAVERVVLRHLEHQLELLRGKDEAAVLAISSIVEDERRHHDHSAEHLHGGKFWPKVLSPVIAASTEAVIWVGMRA